MLRKISVTMASLFLLILISCGPAATVSVATAQPQPQLPTVSVTVSTTPAFVLTMADFTPEAQAKLKSAGITSFSMGFGSQPAAPLAAPQQMPVVAAPNAVAPVYYQSTTATCVGGNCSTTTTATQQRTGWYFGKLLGR